MDGFDIFREKRLHDIEQKRKKDEEARKQRLLEVVSYKQ